MKFNIIENPERNYDPEEVKREYQDWNIPVKDIQEKYDIHRSEWRTLLKQWSEEGIPLRSNRNRNSTPKYYTKDTRYDSYRVMRTINSRRRYFGSYPTEEEAQKRVQELEANNWEGLLR